VTMKNRVFWNITACGSCKNRRRLLVTVNVVPSSPILVTLMMEAVSSSETSVLARATRRNIPEDAVLHFILTPSVSFTWDIFQYVQLTRTFSDLRHMSTLGYLAVTSAF
jgi:hypothetical protein